MAAVALTVAGCGSEDVPAEDGGPAPPPDLSTLTPADPVVYIEAVNRPQGEQKEAIEAIAARFPEGEDLGARIIAEIDESFAKERAKGATAPTYAGEIEPWLGERSAMAVFDIEPGPGVDPPFSAVVEATDGPAAAEAIERLAAASKKEVKPVTEDGLTFYAGADDDGVAGVVEDHVVVASDVKRFEAAADAARGEASTLADSSSFSYHVGDVSGADALAFASVDPATLIEAAAAADPAAAGSTRIEELIDRTGLDLERPASLALTATADRALFDTSVAVTGKGPKGEFAPGAAGALLENVPADSWFALACPACVESFADAFREGLEAELGAGLPGAGGARLERRLGIDLGAFSRGLGDSSLFVRGTDTAALGSLVQAKGKDEGELEGALVTEVKDRGAVEDAVDALRGLLESAGPEAPISDLPRDVPSGTTGFRIDAPPTEFNVALSDDLLVLAAGDAAAIEALSPEEPLGGSERLGSLEAELGGGYELNAYVDLDVALELLKSLAGDPELAEAVPYARPFGLIVGGAAVRDGRLITRSLVTFD